MSPSTNQESRAEGARCATCLKTFRRTDHLKRHELNHQRPRYACDQPACGLRFHRQDVLRRHRAIHFQSHSIALEPPTSQPLPSVCNSDNSMAESIELPPNALDTLFDDWTPPYDILSTSDVIWENNNSVDFSVLSTDVNSVALAECVNFFKLHDLPRLPCIHGRQDQGSQLLQYSMAALGAVHSDQYKMFANEFHNRAKQALMSNPTSLCRLQAQLLSIEFAIWSRDPQKQRWAKAETLDLCINASDYVSQRYNPTSPCDWATWIDREAYKRTIFAIYTTCTLAAAFLRIDIAIHSQDILLPLPSDEEPWTAQSESEWREVVQNHQADGVDFQEAVHVLLHSRTWQDCGLEIASTFTQYICLCAVLETICLSKKLVMNYESVNDWRDSVTTSFRPREALTHSLDVCKSLWLINSEELWIGMSYAHPQEENNLLLQYMFILVNSDNLCRLDGAKHYWIGLQGAVEMFANCSRVGFMKVSKTCRSTISRPGRHCALSCARLLLSWARDIDELDTTQWTQEDQWMQIQVCQAIRRGFGPQPTEKFCSQLEKLAPAISYIWSMMLGKDWS